MLAAVLAACGGDDGATGPAGPAGPKGDTGATGPAGADLTAKVNVAALTPDQWAEASFSAEVTGVTIASPPVVSFKVTDAQGNPVVGLEANTSKSSTATVTSYPNFSFALAKLVPGSDHAASKWVSYIVTAVPTTSTAKDANGNYYIYPQRPGTDNTGTLKGNGDGTYTYTFWRDITTMKAQIAAAPEQPVSTNYPAPTKADLGDLTYDPTLPHRVVIQISGAARGTGSNTADGVTVTPAVNMSNPLNVIYNFTPSTGKPIAAADLTREVVNIASCNACHDKLALHGGNRIDTDYCVVCHTEQRKYGYAQVKSTAFAFPALTETATVNATTGITSYSYAPATPAPDSEVAGNFTTMIHKIHQGGDLIKQNYNYANIAFNLKGFSMLEGGQKMCSVCHDNTKAVNADNWNSVPTRMACGACHDGIDFATGGGQSLNGKYAGHVGGAEANDSQCYLCHGPTDIKTYHQTTDITKHNPTIQDGLVTFTYVIDSATVDATTNDVSIVFGIKQRTAPSTTDSWVTFVPAAASVSNPLTGFTGGPSFLLAYTTPAGGVTSADYDNAGVKQAQALSVSIGSLLSTNNAASMSMVASTAKPGYYVATLKGAGAKLCASNTMPCVFPVGTKMRTVGLQGYFTQVSPAQARHAIAVTKTVTGDTARRTVVDPAKCSNCHEWFSGHGGNRVYQTQICVMCHVPGLATSGRGISDAALTAYPFTAADNKILADWKFDKTKTNAALAFPVTTNNFKDMIHGIHSGRDRVVPFQDARDRTPSAITLLDFRRMDFPGVLSNCNTCHTTSTSATTTFNTVPSTALSSTYESIDAAYAAAITAGTATPAIAKTALSSVSATDTVTTPFAAACASCHDSTPAKAHITLNGGSVKVARSTTNAAMESCAICHGPGSDFDTAVVHK